MIMTLRAHSVWVQPVATLLLIASMLTGCGGSDTTAQQNATPAAAPAPTVTASTVSPVTTTTNPPIATTPTTDSAATTSHRFSLVSSSGKVIDVSNSNQGSSLSLGSTGAVGRPESDGADLTPLSDAEIAAIRATTPAARIIQESVLGFDSRFQVNPYTYPERAVALITYNGSAFCTGWMVSKDTLVTAGHCVHGGGATGRWGTTSAYKIYPGYSDGYAPYGACTPKELYSSSGWINTANGDADVGIIKMNCSVGNSTGYFSYFVANPVDNVAITINGYPGDKANGTQQWGSKGTISRSTAAKLYYDNDTVGGMSGAPVWVQNNNTAWALGIHTNGDSLATGGSNAGTRISQNVFDLITAVKELP
jgi:glutamyl endopeptidase